MKKKKALVALLLAGVLSIGAFAATGCKNEDDPVIPGDNQTNTENTGNGGNGGNGENTGNGGNGGNTGNEQGGNGGNTGNEQGGNGGNTGNEQGGNTDPGQGGNEQGGNNEQGGDNGGNTGNEQGGNNEQGGGNGGNTDPNPTPDPDPEPDEPVALTEDMAISLTAGETKKISAASGATFNSDDATVATVNSDGEITAKTAGIAKVTATTDGSVLTCTVIVLKRLEGSSEAPVKSPFSFTGTKDVGSVSSVVPVEPEVSDSEECVVTFSDGAASQYVEKGYYAIEPVGVENDGHYLTGWKNGGAVYNFNSPVTTNLMLTAQWKALPSGISLVQGKDESIAVEFSGAATTSVQYKLNGTSDWSDVDSPLVRSIGGGSSRVDIVGLKAGTYTVKVGTTEISDIPVKAYDRSGYAHFDKNTADHVYAAGVGAYKNDGTLKDNAVVIYLTDENKDSVMTEVAAKYSAVTMFNIPYCSTSTVSNGNYGGKAAAGIGWWLNNAQYTMDNAQSSSNKTPSNTYDAANGKNLGFRGVNVPIVIRVIGKVTTPEGCTRYSSEGEGGSVGDNGHMARMKNCANITIEGVGEDAMIEGWGIHFMGGTDATGEQGKNFEVRNLTFSEYPEDAVGMEGVQGGNVITGPVEHCWVHHNTFLPGHCANPAESDKKEGDGSCDFKRGQYFTCSYNWFEYCHKTNLIGSSDSSLQFNMTYHHNVWYQCGSRIPLARQSNIHFYNNYVFGDQMNVSTPYSWISKASLSYVHSLRANCYLFSEGNYYEGCKNVTDGKNGGAGKAWNNTYSFCAGTNTLTEVSSREQAVSNSCSYSNFDYSTFDKSPSLFYYDSVNKVSKCLLDDSISARTRALMYSGANGHGEAQLNKLYMPTVEPKSAVTMGSSVTEINVNTSGGSSDKGVYFCSGMSKGKGKGQLVVFTLTAPANLEISATGSGDAMPQIFRADGKMMQTKFSGTVNLTLNAGTYVVSAGQKDKEATISSMKFSDTEGASAARVSAAISALSAIPQTITINSGDVIRNASNAYSALSATEKAEIDSELVAKLQKATNAFSELQVEYVIARIEYIGTVTEYSANDINAAQNAYSSLSATLQSQVTNYAKLTQAQNAFATYAATSVNNYIDTLPESSAFDKITDSLPAIRIAIELFERAVDDYDVLEEEVQKDVKGIAAVKADLETLKAALAAAEQLEAENAAVSAFLETIKGVDKTDISADKAKDIVRAYNAMTAENKATYATNEIYVAAKVVYDAQPKGMVIVLSSADHASLSANGVTVTGGSFKEAAGFSVDSDGDGTDETYQTSYSIGDGSITFTVDVASKITVYITKDGKGETSISSSKTIKINGDKYAATDGNNCVANNVQAGTVTVQKGDSCRICYILVEPVS